MNVTNCCDVPAAQVLEAQRSHILLVLSNAKPGRERALAEWRRGPYRDALSCCKEVLSVGCYQQHEIDLTQGQCSRLRFEYLDICHVVLHDGRQAEALTQAIASFYVKGGMMAEAPATWMYYPVSEKIGRSPVRVPPMITMAFANATSGYETQFREWYVTRHIRDVLQLPAFVSGQCFERTQMQRPGAAQPDFSMIAVYEQEREPESILESVADLPDGALAFPTLDLMRFAEAVFVPT